MNNLEDLIKEWSNGKHSLDDRGICTFMLNDQYPVSIENALDESGFYIYSVIGKVPAENENAIALLIAKANLFGKETGLSSLGYDDKTQTLILFQYMAHENATLASLTHHLNEFHAYRAHWNEKFKGPMLEKIEEPESLTDSLRSSVRDQKLQIFFA